MGDWKGCEGKMEKLLKGNLGWEVGGGMRRGGDEEMGEGKGEG
jgi:hypothetical protein